MSKNYEEKIFGCQSNPAECAKESNKIKEALDRAWEIRNFEIEHYWKRSTYFVAFIAACATGFVSINTSEDPILHQEFISCIFIFLGFVFSYAWYLSCQGSKFWQENWEAHIDCLESLYNQNLYKTVLKNSSTAYSVSRINETLSFVITMAWIALAEFIFLDSLLKLNTDPPNSFLTAILIFLIYFCLVVIPMNVRSDLGKFDIAFLKNEVLKYKAHKRCIHSDNK